MMMPHWSTSLKTAPTSEPLELDEAKGQLRITHTADDALIDALITAAREAAETFTGRALLTQTWYLKLDSFPCDGSVIVVPKAPLSSVTAITYVDTTGVTQTWATAKYQIAKPTGPKAQSARIQPAYSEYYPSTRDQMEAVSVEFVCGYGDALDVPMGIKLGMKAAISDWYMHRGDDSVDRLTKIVPDAAMLLWYPYIVQGW